MDLIRSFGLLSSSYYNQDTIQVNIIITITITIRAPSFEASRFHFDLWTRILFYSVRLEQRTLILAGSGLRPFGCPPNNAMFGTA